MPMNTLVVKVAVNITTRIEFHPISHEKSGYLVEKQKIVNNLLKHSLFMYNCR